MAPSATTSENHAVSSAKNVNGTPSIPKGSSLDWTTFSNVINGKLESTKETRCSINPATEGNNPTVPVASREDVDRAMDAAQKAAKPWAAVRYAERQKAVLAYADGLEANKEGFSKFLTQEQGKPVRFTCSIFQLSS